MTKYDRIMGKTTIITIIFTLFLCHTTMLGQAKKGSKEKIRAYKIAYLTERLDLTEKEASKFWPLYNKYDKAVNELRHESKFKLKKRIAKQGGIAALNESKAKDLFFKIRSLNQQINQISENFYNQLPQILSYKKIIKLEISEREFHRKLIRKLRNKRNFK
ncbi:Protein of unknown function precursor, putative sensor of anti-sigma and ECF sigma factor [Tenacibaculum maritimum]|uniref:sensor of ECF-type sigma factor n=1 Tax=Tenacibaculum maritimum TaxID=107401 RepID=UPI0012E4D591|nr:sensor of ECF-type sigma factor [Tenacibaculum maritimum]CAA0175433.1 Protein of unknown function precursor, putative sensor of anti-sigma and ECF sigma factor [Tenacibaculum maritimum]